ncbi:acyl-CoA synthetase (NDP forming) [Litoreibacter ponti]|uniref:Acyl-CoA synthetase (NDP forming) n=1 Tax=Litoreibacter ponti TaxID=1510457 RepID=A0A2T6BP48_9RHOB|nr:acetate--CoA ligase family protein [Litoreibacter ponti]PTX57845.1 acyl-CoA synthetase (NDP forming) [Litoreibacter ponti]
MPDLSRLFRPRSLAVVGGGAWGEAVLRQAQLFNFEGSLYAVHPSKPEISGIRAYPSVNQLPEVPDATFVGINREASIGAIERLRKLDAGGAVCFASGYAETTLIDHTGADAQARLLRAAGDMPILGPNCYGFINALDGVCVWPDQHGCVKVERGVAILTQSSNISINMTMQGRGLPIAYMIAAGNQAQTTQAQIAETLLDDDRVTAIGLHIEGFGDLRQWESLAAKARAKNVALVALKVGKSTQARSATISHTGSLAGADAGAQAILDRLGILRASDLPSFLETLKLLHLYGRLESNGLGSISCSGGEASMVADMAVDYDLTFPKLSSTQEQALKRALGPKVALANPLDYHTYIWRDEDAMTAAWSAMASPDIAITLIVLDYPRSDRCDPVDWQFATNAALRVRKGTKRPVAVVATLPELMPESVAQTLIEGGVVPFAGLSEALEAIALAAKPLAPADPLPIFDKTQSGSGETSPEFESKQRLASLGLKVPASVRTNHGAAGVEDLQFPVVVKADGLVHKTETGGVILDCKSISEVQEAMDGMQDATSFLVEEMCDGSAELLIGVTYDEAHGYLLTLAAGGTLTELLKDSQTLLLPSRPEAIEQALSKLEIAPLLHGYRGAAVCDIDAIVAAVEAVQSFVIAEDGRIAEVEVNPLLCSDTGAVAVDALIRENP